MALLNVEQRKEYFKALGLGEYNAENILKLQKKYMLRKSDCDGVYGTDTDNLVRHLKAVKDNCTNFAPEEFRCGCNGRHCCGYPTYMKPVELKNIQAIRTHYGKPMVVTCGVRCGAYNREVGGIPNSEHKKGLAVDYYIEGVTDTLANRKANIGWISNLPNHHYTYGNGIFAETTNGKTIKGSVSAPSMGNAMHTDCKEAPSPYDENGKLICDGVGGAATVKEMQRFFGTTQDGVISGQNKAQKKYYPALIAVEYGSGGSPCIRNLQRWVSTTQDGIIGEQTIKAWQKKLGVACDGIFGANSMRAWQKYLNEHDKAVYPIENVTIGSLANEYAYPLGTDKAKSNYEGGSPLPAYADGLNKAYPNRSGWGTASKKGASCDVFVGTCIRNAGVDKDFPRGLKEQIPYLAKSAKFKQVSVTKDTVKDGDIIVYTKTTGGGHICIVFGGKIKEAGHESYYPKTTNTLKTRLSKTGKNWVKVYRVVEETPKQDFYKVIDVSDWQGQVDWEKVKADGVVGTIIRYGDGNVLDKRFAENMKNAKAAGLHIGSYIFSRAKNIAEAEAEATKLYNACKPYSPDMPLYIDLEAKGLEKYANVVAQAFLVKMKELGGRGGVYANLNWWNNYLADTAKNYSSNPFWIAQYNSTMDYKPSDRMGMWQYTSSGSVDGISGKVDMDKCYVAYWEKPKTTIVDKELEACKEQAEWMKNSEYKWQSNPTVEKSKKYGTCVTYVACVLQRLGVLPSGKYIWHNSEGKVVGANDKMTVIYPKNKKLRQLKDELKAGDIIMDGDKSDLESGSHIFIVTGKWKGDNPIVWDNHSAQGQGGKSYTYTRNRPVIAIVRLK